MKLYRCNEPQELIDMFEHLAKQEEEQLKMFLTKRARNQSVWQAATWRAAAGILRDMEFVGWERGK